MLNTEEYKKTTETVREVEEGKNHYFYVTTEDGWGIGIKNVDNLPLPAVGDLVDMYWQNSNGWGGSITGASSNGHDYFYKTRQELENERFAYIKEQEERKQKTYDDNIKDWLHRRDQLIEPLRKRIHRFELKNGFEEFWKEDGGYELFILEQAQVLYLWAMKSSTNDPLGDIVAWETLDYSQQREMIPAVDDRHSGWTWGAMVSIAKGLVEGKKL